MRSRSQAVATRGKVRTKGEKRNRRIRREVQRALEGLPRDGQSHLIREYRSAKSAKRTVDRIEGGEVLLPEGTTLEDWEFDWETSRSREREEVQAAGGADGWSAVYARWIGGRHG